ncbi:dienelactone hydrolase family protein [Bacteriovorax sp. PP10]|uniref:Dienelactone hydrolase family protein n=1 Tax=Bacteriovorax antarcticus TaxID=3088717 RepID=A0ABU5VW63_9BACT|nr:dienelactone hydrolase family protein [Bacteriovorax sp. PP10]MEA9357311.1 dienelactone hydrolase family protein [Bacteriovorax sp. PP10]
MTYSEIKIQTDLPLKYIAQTPADTKNKPLVIFLHGFTRSEQDISHFKNDFFPEFTYLSVRAPLPIYSGHQWFSLQIPPGGLIQVGQEIKNSSKLLEDFIKGAVRKYQTDTEKVFLIGFSQGAMMSYELGLRKPMTVRGIAALSGAMLPIVQSQMKPGHDLKNLAVFIGHGTEDNRIPLDAASAANSTLSKTSISPTFHSYEGLGHTINHKELVDINAWIKNTLSTNRSAVRQR